MAEWITPKTDWKATDYFNDYDYNRIKNNINLLKERVANLYADFETPNLGSDKNSASMIYAREINNIEQTLELINQNSFNLDIGDKKTYAINGYTINYEELNRIESATQILYGTSISYIRLRKHLEIKLKDNHYKYVPRVKVIRHETMDNRFDWRLGQMKGAKF